MTRYLGKRFSKRTLWYIHFVDAVSGVASEEGKRERTQSAPAKNIAGIGRVRRATAGSVLFLSGFLVCAGAAAAALDRGLSARAALHQ